MRNRLVVLATLLVILPLGAQSQDEVIGDDIRALLDEGISLYKRGQLEAAYAKLEEAFQKQPTSDQVRAFMKRVGEDVIAGMMNSEDKNIQSAGYRLFALAKPGEIVQEGKEEILGFINQLDDNSFAVSENAFYHLQNFGEWGLRFLVPVLGQQTSDRLRSRIVRLLSTMGSEATFALAEALESSNAFLRQQAAIVLRNIKDDRALPALAKAYEGAAVEDATLKALLHEALQHITGVPDAGSWKNAKEYYYRLAESFYYSHPAVVYSWKRYHLIWKWDTQRDQITERRVPRFAWNEQVAEEALHDLLTLDPNYVDPVTGKSAWSLLVMVNLKQLIEARGDAEAALQALAVGEVDEKDFVRMLRDLEGGREEEITALVESIKSAGSMPEKLELLSGYLDRVSNVARAAVLGRIPGRGYVYEALMRSLDDGNALVAKACTDALARMGRPEDLPGGTFEASTGSEDDLSALSRELEGGSAESGGSDVGLPLIAALADSDKRVRYAAAEAMVAINPQNSKKGMELVVPALVNAIGEMGVRTVLLVYDVQDENDQKFVLAFRKMLTKLNVFPKIARSAAEGLHAAREFPTEDLIIIQRKLASQIYFREDHLRRKVEETIFDTLRDSVYTRAIPRVLLCDGKSLRSGSDAGSIDKELADAKVQYETTAQGFIRPDVHELDLKQMLEDLFSTPEAQKDAKDRANLIARKAAESLASISTTDTLYPYADAIPALIKTVSPDEVVREDFIRIPAAQALGRYGHPAAIEVLTKVLDQKDSDPERAARQKPLRVACASALSGVFRLSGATPTPEVYDVLKRNLLDGDFDIEVVVGEALGNATLTNEQRLDLQQHRRLQRASYTAEDP